MFISWFLFYTFQLSFNKITWLVSSCTENSCFTSLNEKRSSKGKGVRGDFPVSRPKVKHRTATYRSTENPTNVPTKITISSHYYTINENTCIILALLPAFGVSWPMLSSAEQRMAFATVVGTMMPIALATSMGSSLGSGRNRARACTVAGAWGKEPCCTAVKKPNQQHILIIVRGYGETRTGGRSITSIV